MNKGLLRELGAWNRLEGMFRENFSETALGDRDFRKMKLREYDRIYRLYNGKVQTTDERALIVMLRFQRRKIRRTLYPGLLRRLLNRTTNSLFISLERKRTPIQPSSEHTQDYGSRALPAAPATAANKKEALLPQKNPRVLPAMRYHRQLGKTRRQRKKRKGLRV